MQPFNFRLIKFDEVSIPPDTQVIIRDLIAGVVITKEDLIKWYKRYCKIGDSIDYTHHNKILVIIPDDIQNCMFNINKDYINDSKCCEKYTAINVDKSLIKIKNSAVGDTIYKDFVNVKNEKKKLYSIYNHF